MLGMSSLILIASLGGFEASTSRLCPFFFNREMGHGEESNEVPRTLTLITITVHNQELKCLSSSQQDFKSSNRSSCLRDVFKGKHHLKT